MNYDDALARVLDAANPLDAESRLLAAAAGHCLAEDIHARLTQPPFNASAMDGYAVPPGAGPGAPLQVVGGAEAGSRWDGTLAPGQAVRIFTGAPVPAGAEAVVMQEDVTRDGDTITLTAPPGPACTSAKAGNDFAKGARFWPPGRA